MELVSSMDSISKLINGNEMVLIYFGSKDCGVCNAVGPKIETVLSCYPNIASAHVEVDKALDVAAQYSVFTVPVILVFISGKEVLREARNISLYDIQDKIDRYYKLLFN